MKRKYNFQMSVGKENNYEERLNDFDVAKQSEQSFAEFVPSIRQTEFDLIDVSDNVEFQHKDIDFVLRYKSGYTETIEVKHDVTCFDGRCTGNLCFEIMQRVISTDGIEYRLDGWFFRSKADTLIIMSDVKGKDDYLCTEFDFDDLRQLYKEKPSLFKKVTAYHGCVNVIIKYETLINELGPLCCWQYKNVKRVN